MHNVFIFYKADTDTNNYIILAIFHILSIVVEEKSNINKIIRLLLISDIFKTLPCLQFYHHFLNLMLIIINQALLMYFFIYF